MERLTEKFVCNLPDEVLEKLGIADVPKEDYEIKEVFGATCKEVCEEHECSNCPINKVINKLAAYEDADEQGLLLRLGSKDDKDKLIEVLATKLFQSEFGRCYMCTNSMKNITLDGVNNGCDGGCLTSEKFTVDDFIKKIVRELEYIKWKEAEQALEEMKEVCCNGDSRFRADFRSEYQICEEWEGENEHDGE